MDQSRDYREFGAELPEGVEPGQDGLVIEKADKIFHNIYYATFIGRGLLHQGVGSSLISNSGSIRPGTASDGAAPIRIAPLRS
jgi:hypothetical protein